MAGRWNFVQVSYEGDDAGPIIASILADDIPIEALQAMANGGANVVDMRSQTVVGFQPNPEDEEEEDDDDEEIDTD